MATDLWQRRVIALFPEKRSPNAWFERVLAWRVEDQRTIELWPASDRSPLRLNPNPELSQGNPMSGTEFLIDALQDCGADTATGTTLRRALNSPRACDRSNCSKRSNR